MEKEIRTIPSEVEIRQLEDGKEVITGYAVVFNTDSNDLGGFIERIDPEAMQTANVSDVVALFNHDPNIVLGRTPDTLTLTVDGKGVRYEITPPSTTWAGDVKESIRRKDVRGSSFAFTIKEDKWVKPKTKGEPYRRTITKFDRFFDVSPVTYPAYAATSVDTTIAKRELGIEKDRLEREETDQMEKEKQLAKAKLNIYYKHKKLELHKFEEEK